MSSSEDSEAQSQLTTGFSRSNSPSNASFQSSATSSAKTSSQRYDGSSGAEEQLLGTELFIGTTSLPLTPS